MRALIFVVALAGCSVAPYGEIGVGFRVDRQSDWYLRGERQWTGRNPITQFEVGVEFDRLMSARPSCGYHHWSSLRDGGPFNSNPELYEERAICKLRWGGK